MGTVDAMNTNEILDHALGQLEGPSLSAAEAEIARDPALAARVDRLDSALHRLLDDGRVFEPPAGLASRTAAFVAERVSRRAILDFVPARVPFRWADVAVAAGVLLAGLLTLLPAVKANRERMSQAECGFNLQQLGVSLASYAHRHNHYPRVCGEGAGKPVGWYGLALEGESMLRDPQSLHCPCRDQCPERGTELSPSHMDFAYNVGYHDEAGKAEPITPWHPASVPLLADQPPHDASHQILDGNSPNHGSRGQNVLFSDLHVRWHASRRVSPVDDDLFLNQHRKPAPGVSVHDAALVPAMFQIDGR